MKRETIINGCIGGLILWGLLFAVGYAIAKPVSSPASDSQIYETIDAAVLDAVKLIPPNPKSEYGGSVISCDVFKGYVYTLPVTNGSKTALDWITGAPTEWNCKIVARYHNHLNLSEFAAYFSPGDIYTANSENIPIYLHLKWKNQTSVYDPGSQTTFVKISGHLLRASLGRKL